jgi:4-amino-4-deoxy-L-arabinose transferase-like glycosyltransferase
MGNGGRPPQRWSLALVLLLAFGLRLAWVLVAGLDVAAMGFQFDMTWYQLAAGRIAGGHGLTDFEGVATAQWPPGYPLLLGAVYALVGESVLAAGLLNALLGTLCCLLVYGVGAQLFGRATGLLAGALFAVLPDDIFFARLILSEVFFGTVFCGVVLLFVRWNGSEARQPRWFLLGCLLGAASLIRGIALAFPLVPLTIWLLATRSFRVSFLRVFVLGLGVACVIAPWTIRNYVRMGHPVLIATSVGRTLGHAHSETGGVSMDSFAKRDAFRRQFAHLPQPQREIEEMKAWQRTTIRYMLTHPVEELTSIPLRFYHLFKHGHIGLEWGRERRGPGQGLKPLFGPARDRVLAVLADAYYFALLALALVGMGLAFRPADRTQLVIPLTIAYFSFFHSVVFPGNPRYHATMLPFFCIAAASALVRVPALRRALWSQDWPGSHD